jgi:hypothetical protein
MWRRFGAQDLKNTQDLYTCESASNKLLFSFRVASNLRISASGPHQPATPQARRYPQQIDLVGAVLTRIRDTTLSPRGDVPILLHRCAAANVTARVLENVNAR